MMAKALFVFILVVPPACVAFHQSTVALSSSSWRTTTTTTRGPSLASSRSRTAAVATASSFHRHRVAATAQPSLLRALSSNNDQDTWKAQREEAKATLKRLDDLESSIRRCQQQQEETEENNNDDDDDGGSSSSSLMELKEEMDQVEQDVSKLTSELLPPSGMSLNEYTAAVQAYLMLPLSVRLALCEAIGMTNDDGDGAAVVVDWTMAPAVVTKLYEKRRTLTEEKLNGALQKIVRRRDGGGISETEREMEQLLDAILDGKVPNELELENDADALLPRVTRKEGRSATAQDLEVLMNVLDKTTFVPSEKPKAIPGGYVLQGRNVMSSGRELIDALDSKLPSQWSAQVSLLPQFSVDSIVTDENVLLLLNNDFSPTTSRWLLSLCTASALVTTFLFAVGCYGVNDNVAQRLQDLTAVQDYSGVDWFNDMLAQVLLPLGFIQLMHEFGHFGVAKRDNFKSSPPTLLPFWIIPYMGAKTSIKTSPRDWTSLFDFAFLGPFLGMATSAIFLFTGLQSTLIADADAIQYFPAIPVSVLQLSTLGGSIVDYVFGGAGIVTSQDPSSTLQLHPFAIAGFSGLMMNALAMLPLGSTDGGRLSQAIFGRPAHTIIGGVTWISLLVGSFLLEQQEVLIGAWAVNNIVQNDMEIPCRNEVDQVNLPRTLAAFALWFVAILTITPMSVIL